MTIIYDSSINVSNGDVAQMVEYSLSMRRVQGSIPCFSNDSVLLLMRPVFSRSLVCIHGFLVLVSLTHYFSTTLEGIEQSRWGYKKWLGTPKWLFNTLQYYFQVEKMCQTFDEPISTYRYIHLWKYLQVVIKRQKWICKMLIQTWKIGE